MAEPVPGPGADRGPNSYAPKPRFDYRAPSFLWEHRYLLIIFMLALIVASVLLFRAPHRQYKIDLPPPPPVYVEPIPQRPIPGDH
ncbi:MAG: hypothetical protein ABI356_02520 [Steroidobacteraceae bacterium]